MSYTWTIITLLLTVVNEQFTVLTEDVKSDCGATTNATVGQNAAITCEFASDISMLHSDVRVFHYRQNPVIVLEVLWLDGKPMVTTQSGYEFNGNITTSLVLEIHHVTQEQAGSYECRVSKSSQSSSKNCTLSVHAVDSTTVTLTSSMIFIDSYNTASPEDEKQSYVFIVPIVLGVVVVAIVIFIFIIFKRKTLKRHLHQSWYLTFKFLSATNDPSSQQQVAQVPNRKCANGVEVVSVLIPLCENAGIHIKNNIT